MTHDEAVNELLVLGREARWAFPSSSGRPVPPSAPAWADRMVKERPDLLRAVQSLVDRHDAARAMELAASTWRAWVLGRDDAGGRAFVAIALDARGGESPSRHRAVVLYGDSLFAFRLGDLVASRRRAEEALAVARKVGDRESEGLALLALSRVELSEGRNEDARKHAAESRAAVRALDTSYGQAPLHMLAQATRFVGTAEEAATLFEESLALNRRLGDRGMVLVELHNLGHAELRRGNADKAERLFAESAALAGEGDPYDQAMNLFNRAAVALARGDRAKASTLVAEVRAVLRREAITLATDDAQELEDLERRLAP